MAVVHVYLIPGTMTRVPSGWCERCQTPSVWTGPVWRLAPAGVDNPEVVVLTPGEVAIGLVLVARDVRVRAQRPGEHEPDAAGRQDVRHLVAHAGLQAPVGDLREAVGVREEVRGLGRPTRRGSR